MSRTSAISGLEVVGRKDKVIGTVTHVLFRPGTLEAVGLEVRLNPVGYVVERKPQYLPLDAVEVTADAVTVTDHKAVGSSAEKRLGVVWDETIIWDLQDVVTRDGTLMGQVKDVVFDASGVIRRIVVSAGLGAQVAVGSHTIEAADIIGFDGDAVRVRDAADNKPMSGGVAAQAGQSAAVAKHVAGKAAGSVLKAGVKAARSAGKSDTGKAVAKGWRSFTDGFKEGLKGEDE